MCTDEQHEQHMHMLQRVETAIISTEKRPPIDTTPQVSTTQPLVIDYKNRRHLFIWSPNTLTFSIEDIGNITASANTWVNIGYQEGMRLVPSTQTATVPVFIRATDETVP